jgi:hypothetical protein
MWHEDALMRLLLLAKPAAGEVLDSGALACSGGTLTDMCAGRAAAAAAAAFAAAAARFVQVALTMMRSDFTT